MILFRLSCRIWSLVIQLIKFSFSFIYIVPSKALSWGGISDSAGSAIQQTAQGMGDKTMGDLKQSAGIAQRGAQSVAAKQGARAESQGHAAGLLNKGETTQSAKEALDGKKNTYSGLSDAQKSSERGKSLRSDIARDEARLAEMDNIHAERAADGYTGNRGSYYQGSGVDGGRSSGGAKPASRPSGGAAPAAAPAASASAAPPVSGPTPARARPSEPQEAWGNGATMNEPRHMGAVKAHGMGSGSGIVSGKSSGADSGSSLGGSSIAHEQPMAQNVPMNHEAPMPHERPLPHQLPPSAQ